MAMRSGRAFYWIVAGLLLAACFLPYHYAATAGDEDEVFGGFLLNPIDGNSYLAKMQQGFHGSWTANLPYTAQKSSGAFLFTYYLFLGHFASWTNLPLLWVYHLVRLAGSLVLWVCLYRFIRATLADEAQVRLAFLLAALGSGIGWLALPAGAYTADFWVAEAYPFLSAFAAPHFSLGLGILIGLLTPTTSQPSSQPARRFEVIQTVILSFCLALLSPFRVVVALVGLAWPCLKALVPLRRGSISAVLGERLPWVLGLAVVRLPPAGEVSP